MAKGSSKKRVYIPQDVNVQMAADDEHPTGRLLRFKQGWHELDDEVLNHPVLSKLIPESDSARQRRERLAKAEDDYRAAVDEAEQARFKVIQEVADEEQEERQRLTMERGERAEEAARKGLVFNEPHPDREAAIAAARTGDPSGHMVPSETMGQVDIDTHTRTGEDRPKVEPSHGRATLTDEKKGEPTKTRG